MIPATISMMLSTTSPVMGLEGEVGVIAPGKLADIVIWNSDPLADITVLQRPSENFDHHQGRPGRRSRGGRLPPAAWRANLCPCVDIGLGPLGSSGAGRQGDRRFDSGTSVVRTPHPSREWVARALLEIDQHGPLTELAIAVGPRVRISFAPAASLQTLGPGSGFNRRHAARLVAGGPAPRRIAAAGLACAAVPDHSCALLTDL